MSTKDYCLLSRGDRDFANDNQFTNLNLNQNNKNFFLDAVFSKNAVKTIEDQKKSKCDSLFENNLRAKNYLWDKKASKINPTRNLMKTMNDDFDSKEKAEKWNNLKNCNSSTLSLHIAAYEKSAEDSDASNFGDKKGDSGDKSEKLVFKRFLPCSISAIENPFEFPRPQKNHGSKPQVMQFKASQRLLNPNEKNFGGDPPPKTPTSDPFDDNQYEIPVFGNVPPPPPPPPAKEKSIASDSLASHKGRLSYQNGTVKNKKQQQKLNPEALKNYKKNKTKGSIQQDELKSKSAGQKSPNDAGDPFEDGDNKKKRKTKSGEKKSGASKSGVISVSNKPSAEVASSMATGNDASVKPKRKKTAQEIIAERQRYRGNVKKDLIISLIIGVISLIVVISTIIGIGAATDFKYDSI